MKNTKLTQNTQGFGLLLVIIVVVIVGGVIITAMSHKAGEGTKLHLSNGCNDTNISVQPLTMATLDSPVTLQAKLTMGAQPVVDERITFRLVSKDSQGHALQLLEGYAQTDANGIGKLTKSAGFADDSITLGKNGTVGGYEAVFDGASAIKQNEPFYCGSHATANLSIQNQK